jgi:uncharacterized protein (DUF924 family)
MPPTRPVTLSYMDWIEVIDFWFNELDPKDWFRKDDSVDARIAQRFRTVHEAAASGELWHWRSLAPGALAEIIVLDQFSRNMFRNDPRAFATDGMALVLAQEAVRRSLDRELPAAQKSFMYLPFMHSESGRIQQTTVELFSQPGLEENLDFELRYKSIIDRFGRFPHRNQMLGRPSTAEELDFLETTQAF